MALLWMVVAAAAVSVSAGEGYVPRIIQSYTPELTPVYLYFPSGGDGGGSNVTYVGVGGWPLKDRKEELLALDTANVWNGTATLTVLHTTQPFGTTHGIVPQYFAEHAGRLHAAMANVTIDVTTPEAPKIVEAGGYSALCFFGEGDQYAARLTWDQADNHNYFEVAEAANVSHVVGRVQVPGPVPPNRPLCSRGRSSCPIHNKCDPA
eukprot:Sspe_Gene.92521::Locus_64898_Transcript_1_1_Confidence_1.000_Length_1257::g.92521::m.92521